MKEHKIPDCILNRARKSSICSKAHAAAYVMMAFRIAWFKVYYPEAFYAVYFTVKADEFDAILSSRPDRVRYEIKELERKGNDMTQKERILTILKLQMKCTRGNQLPPR